MSRRFIVAVCLLALIGLKGGFALANNSPAPNATQQVFVPLVMRGEASPTQPQRFEEQVIVLVNQERAKIANCPALTPNAALNTSAENHSRDMAVNNYFDHTAPDGSTPASRARAAGYPSSFVGENIAFGYTSPEEVMAAWMTSDGHRDNILNCAYRDIGVGYYSENNASGGYWTQTFGRP